MTASDQSPLQRRRRSIIYLAVTAIALMVLSFFVGTQVKSPAQIAAETAPPPPSVLTASVVKRVLTSTIVLRGTVVAKGATTLDANTVAGAGGQPVVTALPFRQGQAVPPGRSVIELSGRPVIALPGVLPPYRDLRPGDYGPDVAQLRAALRRAGLSTQGDPPATYGPRMTVAVQRLYQRDGYRPPPIGLPMSEVTYVPRMPATLASLSVVRGQRVNGPILKLTTGRVAVRGYVTSDVQSQVRRNSPATILAETSDKSYSAVVDSLATQQSFQGTGQQAIPLGYKIVVSPKAKLPSNLIGQDVRVTIVSAATTRPVLAVPVSAISATADGTDVLVRRNGAQQSVPVTTGSSADGLVQVEPVRGAHLSVGEQVVVGVQRQ